MAIQGEDVDLDVMTYTQQDPHFCEEIRKKATVSAEKAICVLFLCMCVRACMPNHGPMIHLMRMVEKLKEEGKVIPSNDLSQERDIQPILQPRIFCPVTKFCPSLDIT